MKNIILYFLLIVLGNSISFTQDKINITESNDTTICGKIVVVDALWVYEGTLKADISILEKQNSKPITGGYKKGDEITISSEPGCTYYVYSIVKYGTSKNKGSVSLSKTAPDNKPEIKDGTFSELENTSFKVGEYDWYISSIYSEGNNITANISITKNTALIENLTLIKGDMVWLGEYLYKVETIRTKFKDNIKDPSGNYEYNPGEITFKAVKEYLNEK